MRFWKDCGKTFVTDSNFYGTLFFLFKPLKASDFLYDFREQNVSELFLKKSPDSKK